MFSAVEEILHHAVDVQLLMRVVELGHLDIAGPDVVITYRERVDRLRHLKDALEKMSWSQNDLTVPAAEAIANGCRTRQLDPTVPHLPGRHLTTDSCFS